VEKKATNSSTNIHTSLTYSVTCGSKKTKDTMDNYALRRNSHPLFLLIRAGYCCQLIFILLKIEF